MFYTELNPVPDDFTDKHHRVTIPTCVFLCGSQKATSWTLVIKINRMVTTTFTQVGDTVTLTMPLKRQTQWLKH